MTLRVRWIAAAITLLCTGPVPFALAQTPAARLAFKGIFEPVSYTEDLHLTDVFFVTVDVGWATGAGGTIIHTSDGGATWTAQLGGDPASAEPTISDLRFVDEHRGWAVQGKKLLRTTNGQDWEEVSGALPNRLRDYTFISGRRGVASGTTASQGNATQIFVTTDAGMTWKVVADCTLRVAIEGVNRNVSCIIDRFQFTSPRVGYLVAYVECVGMCGGPPILGKTEDGGETWRFMLGPGDVKMNRLKDLFFIDDRTGFVHGYTYPGEPKIFATADGGETWKGVVGSPGTWLRFADPEVGWGFEEHKLNYTADGGARWNSRPHRFPAHPRAVSFPRRDRGFVVGDNGMVFRYRVVPAAQATPPEVIVTAAMPAFGSPLAEQVGQVETTLAELAAAVERAPDAASGAATSPPGSEPARPDPDSAAPPDSASPIPYEGAELVPASSFASACCGKPLSKLDVILAAVVQGLPQFASRFRNTNLLTAGLRMLSTLPSQLGALRSAYLGFKQSGDKDSARAALDQLTGAVSAFHQGTKAAFQLEIPPPEASPNDSPADALLQTTGSTAAIVDSTGLAAQADSLSAGVTNEIGRKVKKGLGGLIKKKVRIP